MSCAARWGSAVWFLTWSFGCHGGPPSTFDTGGPPVHVDTGIDDVVGARAADGVAPVFELTSPVHGRIDVVHTGYVLPDCATWDVFVSRPDQFTLVVDYGRIGDTAEECSDTCVWTFTYSIGVDDGDWTVRLLQTGEERTVTVR